MKRMIGFLMLFVFFVGAYGVQAQSATDLHEGWNRIEPGGDTVCSDGSDYAFWVHPGTNARLTIFFMGGGACWNDITCTSPLATYFQALPVQDDYLETEGIFDFENADNPLKDDTIVTVPYCTGDVHFGNNVQTYTNVAGDSVDIHHKGFVNASTVLAWTYENYPQPEEIFVTGCSAGSLGASLHVPYVFENYPDTTVRHLGDSFLGVAPGTTDAFENWHHKDNFSPTVEGFDKADFQMPEYDAALYAAYPDREFAQILSAYDEVQALFYGFLAIDEWTGPMQIVQTQTKVDELEPVLNAALTEQLAVIDTENHHYFLMGGDQHCYVDTPFLYEAESNGVSMLDWVNAYLAGEEPADVDCSDCETGVEVSQSD